MFVHPIEDFLLKYIQSNGGIWEQVEPQVYDVILTDSLLEKFSIMGASGQVRRFCFDPEAALEHPEASYINLGDPSLDPVFQDAVQKGRAARIYLNQFNLDPHALHERLMKEVCIDKGIACELGGTRTQYFLSILFSFQATYLSDEKQQETFVAGIDMHYGRINRSLQELLKGSEISFERPLPYPDAFAIEKQQGYAIAVKECMEHVRRQNRKFSKELNSHYEKESFRIQQYFRELREELKGSQKRRKGKEEDVSVVEQKLHSYEMEEKARLLELRKKLTLKAEIRLLNLLYVYQPKLRTPLQLKPKRCAPVATHLVWDPVTMATEPLPCPGCQMPTLSLCQSQNGSRIFCPACG